MKVIADYHTHTIYSHGMGTIEENVKEAINKGLKIIGITDHGPGYLKYGINKDDYKKMRQQVDRLKEKYYGIIDIFLGVEANIMDIKGSLDIDDDILNHSDILLAGFHFDITHKESLSEVRSNLKRYENIKSKIDKSLYNEILEINTEAIIKAMNIYDINIITHPNDKQPINILKVAQSAADTNTAFEINNFHRHPNLTELNQAMMVEKLQFVISSDAHRPKDVGNFFRGLKLLNSINLHESRVKNIET